MKLRSLETRNFRNLEVQRWDFHPVANVIVGDNGQGKTNLIEAVYLLATTRSFRTPRTANVVQFGTNSTFVQGETEHEGVLRTLSIGLQVGDERKRELQLNGQKVSLAAYLPLLQLLAYSSTQIEILRGGPEWRRRFIDRGVASLRPSHLNDLSRYMRALRQRNALLAELAGGRARKAQLDAWDEELVVAAQPLVLARATYVSEVERHYRNVVESHRYHVADLHLAYEPSLTGDLAQDRETVARNRPRDLRLRHSSAGPHRDELRVERRGQTAVEILSSGETKMTVLFLTMAALEAFRDRFDYAPIFLLDDVDAELDLGILQRLVTYLVSTTQLFTTSAKEPFLEKIALGEHRKFTLTGGRLTACKDGGF